MISGLACAALAIAVLAGAVALYIFDPTKQAIFPPCPLHSMTGLYCPGCGSTRALHQLAHGHLATAFHFNPLLIVAGPLLALVVSVRYFRKKTHPDLPPKYANPIENPMTQAIQPKSRSPPLESLLPDPLV